MKEFILFLLFLLFMPSTAKSETEPNNDYTQANILLYNGLQNGSISDADVVDWYKINVPQGGVLRLLLNSNGGPEATVYLRDSAQLNTELAYCSVSFNDRTRDSIIYPLLKGTYYAVVVRSRGSGTYSLESSLKILQWTEDKEPNNESTTALNLPVNGSVTGLTGHYDPRVKTFDPMDWYKIIVPQGGNLRLQLYSDGGSEGTFYLKDSSNVNADLTNAGFYFNNKTRDSIVFPVLKGTYYLTLIRSRGSGAYKIESSLQILQWTEDTEPNNESTTALNLPVNGSVTGLTGHYDPRVKTFDPMDWYKITVPKGGNLRLQLYSDGGPEGAFYLKDSSNVNADLTNASFYFNNKIRDSIIFPVLKGTYYLTLIRSRGSGAYKIESSLQILQWTEDSEPNNESTTALNLPVNGSVTGLTGHYDPRVKTFDPSDWYKITVPQGGNLRLQLYSDGGPEGTFYFKDSSNVNADLTNAGFYFNNKTRDSIVFPVLKGTYYLTLIRSRGSGAYKIESSLQILQWGEDKEPNDKWQEANEFPITTTVSGLINHYNPPVKNYDGEDWFKIKTDNRGLLVINLQSDSSSEASIYLKDSAQLNSNLATASFYFGNKVQDSLVAPVLRGTYYMVVYRSRGSGAYRATSKLIQAPKSGFAINKTGNGGAFENTTTGNATDYSWNFDDGTTSTTVNPFHEFKNPGVFDICLIAKNRGGSDTSCQSFVVQGLARVFPNQAGNTGVVTLSVFGGGLDTFYKVRLVQNGQTKLSSIQTGFGGKGAVAATLDLHGVAVGSYDIVVEKQGGQSYTLPNGFTIIQGVEADPWVTISGGNRILFNTWTTYTITYGNNGNVDAEGVPLWIAISNQSGVEIDMSAIKIVLPDEAYEWGLQKIAQDMLPYTYVDSLFGEPFKGKVYAYMIPFIAPGVTKSFPIKIKTNQDIEVMAWVNPPYYRSPFISDIWECAKKELLTSAIKDGIFSQVKELFGAQTECLLSVLDKVNSLRGEATREDRKIDGTTFGTWVYGYGLTLIKCGLAYAPGTGLAATFFSQLAKTQKRLAQAAKILDCARLKDNQRRTIKAVSSLDPNEKIGITGLGTANYIGKTEYLPYTINFENKASATAPAHTVVVTDQLDATKFDFSSFRFDNISIADSVFQPQSGSKDFVTDYKLNNLGVTARVQGSFNSQTGLVKWVFRSLDSDKLADIEDPDKGILPPNAKPPIGQGCVSFTVKLKNAASHDFKVMNKASIVFDANTPIITNDHLITFDLKAPESAVVPLATTTNNKQFTVSWTGSDAGAGVEFYKIYVAVNGKGDSLWLTTKEKSAVFTGEIGNTYSFYSVAVDKIGNEETAPTRPDAQTSLTVGIKEPWDTNLLAVFPNPAKDQINLLFQIPVRGTITLYRSDGSIVLSEILRGETNRALQVGHLPTGMYYWKWTAAETGHIALGKVVLTGR